MSDSDDDSCEFYDAVSEASTVPSKASISTSTSTSAGVSETPPSIVEGNESESDDEGDNTTAIQSQTSACFSELSQTPSSCSDVPNPSSKASSSPKASPHSKTIFGSSIRSLFGGLSNIDRIFDVNGESDSDSEDYNCGDLHRHPTHSFAESKSFEDEKKDVKDTRQSGNMQSLKKKETHGPQSPKSTRKSNGSSIWNFFSFSSGGEDHPTNSSPQITKGGEKKTGVKVSLMGKKQPSYSDVNVLQVLEYHHGPIWVMRFSHGGKFLASGGQDGKAIVWSVGEDRREKCLVEIDDDDDDDDDHTHTPPFNLGSPSTRFETRNTATESFIFPTPCRVYGDHDGHIVDMSWSSKDFLLTACLDKIVRLWHVKSPACLQKFKHPDLVSSIEFHPVDDRYFVSGCFDKVLRLWDTTKDSEPLRMKEAQDMITAVAFTPDGSRVAVGLFRGQVFFYKTEDFKIETQIVCTKSNSKRKVKYGFKVTALVFRTVNERRGRHSTDSHDNYELLVTTNDSSIRLYQVKDLSLTTKFKGIVNKSKPIRASFSNHGHHIICGSDSTGVFIWKVPKRRHMENKHRKLKELFQIAAAKKEREVETNTEVEERNGIEEVPAGDEVIGREEDTWRARLESLYYSKKYEVYEKCERFVCDDNFKHLCTTVAIYAPHSALMEGAIHLSSSTPGTFENSYNIVILDAEIDGTIRIIRAKTASNLV